ncbi:cold-shock protein [Rhodococcus pyridinivorans]
MTGAEGLSGAQGIRFRVAAPSGQRERWQGSDNGTWCCAVVRRRSGHGFIRDDDGTEILVHYSQMDGSGYRFLTGGQRVRFEIGYGIFGRQAVNVQVC